MLQRKTLASGGRVVARGGRAEPPSRIWQISEPYSNQGSDYAPHTTASPPGFKKLSTTLGGLDAEHMCDVEKKVTPLLNIQYIGLAEGLKIWRYKK